MQLLIVKTPFRVSLFGGGTDIPNFFKRHGGEVLGFAITKYSYVTIRDLLPFYNHSIRLAYSKIERCKNYEEINHPLIKAALEDFKCNNIEIHYDSDLPGMSGIGSSSSFAVGLAHCLFTYKSNFVNNESCAEKAIYWERHYLKEKGGYQDQLFSAYGGFNHIKFNMDGSYYVKRLDLKNNFKKRLEKQTLLCYLPQKRLSYDNSVENHLDEKSTILNLLNLKDAVKEALELIKAEDIYGLGKLLNESWKFKKSLPNVSNQNIEDVYEIALKNGAIGGKILGAGKSGFMFFICKEDSKINLKESLKPLITISVGIDDTGSKLIYSEK